MAATWTNVLIIQLGTVVQSQRRIAGMLSELFGIVSTNSFLGEIGATFFAAKAEGTEGTFNVVAGNGVVNPG